ncbi:MAG: hypothetical protein RMJ56_08370 [Gemmataceae bacterium]|nr:hypothetical protein [Gemmata sp.]MDW8197606.1 hypothetical protein [Gemmataceae bacterium]
MQTWRLPAFVVAIGFAISGCGPIGSREPLTTDGPNQVILLVPGMT